MTDPRPEDRPAADAPDTAALPEPTAAPEPSAAPADPRPRPAYGEYAPEGWSWTPPQEAGSAPAAAPATAPQSAPGPVPTASPVTGPSDVSGEAEVPTRLPGVPHNLGAPASRGATAPQHGSAVAAPPTVHQAGAQHSAAQLPTGAPAQQQVQQHPQQPAPAQAPLPQQAPPQPTKPRTADRVITVFLLVIGAFGALNTAFELYRFPQAQQKTAEMLGLSDYTPPSWLGPVGIVCAIVVLAIYAVSLILSVRRLRANKLTFFVPLIAGVVAFLLFFVLAIAAVASSPELLQASQDPDAISKLLESMRSTTSN